MKALFHPDYVRRMLQNNDVMSLSLLFIALGYAFMVWPLGYENIYELGPLLDVNKTKLPFEGTEIK
jgi:hypothetical protein